MARRIEIELTGSHPDGDWTWRAAGARLPRGTLAADLVYPGAQVGDVVRADADFALEGIAIVRLYPPKTSRPQPGRVELVGTSTDRGPVTTSLVSRSGRAPGDRPGRPSPPSGSGRRSPGARSEPGDDRERRGRAPRPASGGPRMSRPGEGGDQPKRREDDQSRRPPSPSTGGPAGGTGPRRGGHRLNPANTHRAAALAAVAPEQRPIAEQVLRGGIPAVRQAIDAQNAQARADGQPEVAPGPFLALAEELLPRLKAAAWRDRAEAVVAAGDRVALHDLRSVVMGADAGARDAESRLLAAQLREAFYRRVEETRRRWVEEIAAGIDADKLLRALRASARPPDPGARFPAELAVRLSQAAGAAMTPQVPPERWTTLLEAVAHSPVRRMVKPEGLPAEPGGSLMEAARHEVGRVPALAPLLGIDMPPPPGPPRPSRPAPPRPTPVSHPA